VKAPSPPQQRAGRGVLLLIGGGTFIYTFWQFSPNHEDSSELAQLDQIAEKYTVSLFTDTECFRRSVRDDFLVSPCKEREFKTIKVSKNAFLPTLARVW